MIKYEDIPDEVKKGTFLHVIGTRVYKLYTAQHIGDSEDKFDEIIVKLDQIFLDKDAGNFLNNFFQNKFLFILKLRN